MRIDAYAQIQQLYGTKNVKKTEENKTTGSSFRDQFLMSAVGKDAQIAKQAIANTPDVREDMVSTLKEKIDHGTYEVSAEEFADKLLEKYNGLF